MSNILLINKIKIYMEYKLKINNINNDYPSNIQNNTIYCNNPSISFNIHCCDNILVSSIPSKIQSNYSSTRNTLQKSTLHKQIDNTEAIYLARKYQIIGSVMFSISSIIIKIAVEHFGNNFPQFNYIVLRFLGIFILTYLKLKLNINMDSNTNNEVINSNDNNIESLFILKNKTWITIRCLAWIMSFLCYSISLIFVKMGIATLILMMSPIIQNVLFSIVFRTPLDLRYIYACIISFLGIYLLLNGNNLSDTNLNVNNLEKDVNSSHSKWFNTTKGTLIGTSIGILNAISIAVIFLCTKKLSVYYNMSNINYICCFWSTLTVFILNILFNIKSLIYYFDLMFLLYSFFITIFSFFGFYYVNLAVITAEVSKSSYLMYIQLPIISIFGIILYQESYCLLEYVGFIIIMISCLYTSLYIR